MLRLIAAALALAPAAAFAQDAERPVADVPVEYTFGETVASSQGRGGPAIGFTLNAGVSYGPEYFGADDGEARPAFGGELNYLRLGGFTFGDPDPLFRPQGLGVIGSFRYIGDRDDDDSPELEGLDDVDASLEIGGGLRYATRDAEVFGVLRYGVIGHDGFVAEFGADALAQPTERLSLRAGPRLLFGDDDYAETYFGVSGSESAASVSGYDAFDADGGLLSAGIALGASYALTDRWGVDASVTYDRFLNDASDSPITRDDTNLTATLGVTRRFTLGF